ncbi:hypothetical protein EYF80_041644 [Liparis tanakae]|uniref:Uncharacterized protein n=1 Tax=Liparis tanakae TaxID=230148 RepID=A0A4Z2G5X6_9TELE|nr:hypothetical protein EYF80_041644 [Liparis tanakae]
MKPLRAVHFCRDPLQCGQKHGAFNQREHPGSQPNSNFLRSAAFSTLRGWRAELMPPAAFRRAAVRNKEPRGRY